MTAMFPAEAVFPTLFGRTHAGLIVCVLAAVALGVFLHRTRLGFELRPPGKIPAPPVTRACRTVFCWCWCSP